MQKLWFAVLALLALVTMAATPASATVLINVDLTSQTMRVQADGQTFVWPVSTARAGFSTPHGIYHPQSLQVMHYSRKYDNAPMPHSIFFHGGYAIHGTYETAALGRPASHGCVRLSGAHAATLFAMVRQQGATIAITGTSPASRTLVAKAPRHHKATRVAAVRIHRAAPLAYAPVGYPPQMPPVRLWQRAPIGW